MWPKIVKYTNTLREPNPEIQSKGTWPSYIAHISTKFVEKLVNWMSTGTTMSDHSRAIWQKMLKSKEVWSSGIKHKQITKTEKEILGEINKIGSYRIQQHINWEGMCIQSKVLYNIQIITTSFNKSALYIFLSYEYFKISQTVIIFIFLHHY